MSLNLNALATFDEVREEIKVKSQATEATIERRINALSQTFEEESGLILKEQLLTGFRVDSHGTSSICVPLLPVQAVTKIDMRWEFDDSPYVDPMTDPTAWLLKDMDRYGHSHTGLLQLLLVTAAKSWAFPAGKANILLDMKIGYAKTHPRWSEVQRLFFLQLAYEYKRWEQNEIGISGRSLSDGSVTFNIAQNLLKEVVDGLSSMRLRRL
jgi:hypothetical protein